MPFPNSQSPVTLKLNELFTDPSAIAAFTGPVPAAAALRNNAIASSALALFYGVIPQDTGAAAEHVDKWPVGQQKLVRRTLADAIDEDRPVTFDWQVGTQTRVDIIDFGTGPIGITFRSPAGYPPYTGS